MKRYSKYLSVALILIVRIMLDITIISWPTKKYRQVIRKDNEKVAYAYEDKKDHIALVEVSLEGIESIYKTFDTPSPDYESIRKLIAKSLAMPLEEVVPIFEDAIERLSRHADILHISLGYIYASKNASDKALEEFNKVEKEPGDSLWQVAKYYGLGMAYLAKGDTSKAIENFENAISILPNQSSIYLKLGDVYYGNLKDPQKAKYYYSEYIRLNLKAENKN